MVARSQLAHPEDETFLARLTAIDGKKLEKFDLADEATAMRLKAALEGGRFVVQNVESKAQRRHPAPPFTTSTLQQEASRKLGFSPRHTMQLAQRLYEGVDMGGESEGLITICEPTACRLRLKRSPRAAHRRAALWA